MPRPKRTHCSKGHLIKTRGNGSRYCPQCDANRRKERRSRAVIGADAPEVEALRTSLLARMREMGTGNYPKAWDGLLDRLESLIEGLDSGKASLRRRRRVVKVRYRDERLCEECRGRLFPDPHRSVDPDVELARGILNS